MSWREEMRLELQRAEASAQSGHEGRVRTCLRRAIGFAVSEWQRRDPSVRFGADFMRQLRGVSEHPAVPEHVRDAAERLAARLGEDFRSRSATPMEDARTVLRYVLGRMGEDQEIN